MGLDLEVGLRNNNDSTDNFEDPESEDKKRAKKFASLKDVLRYLIEKHALEIPDEFKRDYQFNRDDIIHTGRAYFLRACGELCREKNFDYPHISRITCSKWQMIVPVEFDDPIGIFADRTPAEYNLSIPPSYYLSASDKEKFYNSREEEDVKFFREELGIRAMVGLSPDYLQYYRETPEKEIFMLSSHRLAEEFRDLKQKAEEREEDSEDFIESCEFALSVFEYSIRSGQVIWFCG